MTETKQKPQEKPKEPIRSQEIVITLTDAQKKSVREAKEAREKKMDLPPVKSNVIRAPETVIRAELTEQEWAQIKARKEAKKKDSEG